MTSSSKGKTKKGKGGKQSKPVVAAAAVVREDHTNNSNEEGDVVAVSYSSRNNVVAQASSTSIVTAEVMDVHPNLKTKAATITSNNNNIYNIKSNNKTNDDDDMFADADEDEDDQQGEEVLGQISIGSAQPTGIHHGEDDRVEDDEQDNEDVDDQQQHYELDLSADPIAPDTSSYAVSSFLHGHKAQAMLYEDELNDHAVWESTVKQSSKALEKEPVIDDLQELEESVVPTTVSATVIEQATESASAAKKTKKSGKKKQSDSSSSKSAAKTSSSKAFKQTQPEALPPASVAASAGVSKQLTTQAVYPDVPSRSYSDVSLPPPPPPPKGHDLSETGVAAQAEQANNPPQEPLKKEKKKEKKKVSPKSQLAAQAASQLVSATTTPSEPENPLTSPLAPSSPSSSKNHILAATDISVNSQPQESQAVPPTKKKKKAVAVISTQERPAEISTQVKAAEISNQERAAEIPTPRRKRVQKLDETFDPMEDVPVGGSSPLKTKPSQQLPGNESPSRSSSVSRSPYKTSSKQVTEPVAPEPSSPSKTKKSAKPSKLVESPSASPSRSQAEAHIPSPVRSKADPAAVDSSPAQSKSDAIQMKSTKMQRQAPPARSIPANGSDLEDTSSNGEENDDTSSSYSSSPGYHESPISSSPNRRSAHHHHHLHQYSNHHHQHRQVGSRNRHQSPLSQAAVLSTMNSTAKGRSKHAQRYGQYEDEDEDEVFDDEDDKGFSEDEGIAADDADEEDDEEKGEDDDDDDDNDDDDDDDEDSAVVYRKTLSTPKPRTVPTNNETLKPSPSRKSNQKVTSSSPKRSDSRGSEATTTSTTSATTKKQLPPMTVWQPNTVTAFLPHMSQQSDDEYCVGSSLLALVKTQPRRQQLETYTVAARKLEAAANNGPHPEAMRLLYEVVYAPSSPLCNAFKAAEWSKRRSTFLETAEGMMAMATHLFRSSLLALDDAVGANNGSTQDKNAPPNAVAKFITQGTKRSPKDGECIVLVRRAADLGHPGAMHEFGVYLWESGKGAEAIAWLHKAAESGEVPTSEVWLAEAYEHGLPGLKADPVQGAEWRARVDSRKQRTLQEQTRKAAEEHASAERSREDSMRTTEERRKFEENFRQREVEMTARIAMDPQLRAAVRNIEWGYYASGVDQVSKLAMQGNGDARDYLDPDISGIPPTRSGAIVMYHIGLYHASVANPKFAVKWFRRSAEAGHLEGMLTLAAYLIIGKGLERPDPGQAMAWLMKCWEAGKHKEAALALGEAYTKGIGVPPDPSKAVLWYTRAWDTGKYSEAAFAVALAYATGFPPGAVDPAKWTQNGGLDGYNMTNEVLAPRAKTRNNGSGKEDEDRGSRSQQRGLGHSQSVPQGLGKGGRNQHHERSCSVNSQGSATSSTVASPSSPVVPTVGGRKMLKGLMAVQQDVSKAAMWYKRAVEQNGHPRASNNLGELYMTGRGVLRDDSLGFLYFKKAAIAGLAEAEYNVGRCYREGRGCTRDEAQAVAWFKKAEAKGISEATVALNNGGR